MAEAIYSTETWKDIPEWEGLYQASSMGRIRSVEREHYRKARSGKLCRFKYKGRVLRQAKNEKGYCVVVLSDATNGRNPLMHRVHRLICRTFHGEPEDAALEAAHNDGVRDNNRAENLRWATRADNMADVRKHRLKRLAIGG